MKTGSEQLCVFCEIVRGQAAASIVYQDPRILAFMDIQPVNRGHILVVPRAHASQLADLDPDLGADLFRVAARLAAAVRRSGIPCDGVNLYLADGPAAGQQVPHVHIHVLPRFWRDGFGFRFPPGYSERPVRAELEEAASSIRRALHPPAGAGEAGSPTGTGSHAL